MKHKYILSTFLLFCVLSFSGFIPGGIEGMKSWGEVFGQITFQRKISPGFINSSGIDMKQTADSGYVILGNNRLSSNGVEQIILLKTNKYGEVIWSKSYQHPDYTNSWIEGRYIQVTSDGYIIVGTVVTGSLSNFNVNAFIMKTDANGDLQWQKEIGGGKRDYAYSVEPTSDGGYIVSGSTASYGSGGIDSASQGSSNQYAYDLWLIKLNNAGNSEWAQTFGKKSTNEYGSSVKQTFDKGYIIAGTATVSPNSGLPWTRGFLVKTDSTGTLKWTRYIGDSIGARAYSAFSSVEQTPDSGFVIAGVSVQPWLVKTDKLGNVSWNKIYNTEPQNTRGGSHYPITVHRTDDGGYALGLRRDEAPYAYYYLLKTNADGDLSWSKKYGNGEYGLNLRAMVTDIGGGYALAGIVIDAYLGSGLVPGYVYMVKTDLAGKVADCNALSPAPDVLSPAVYSTPVAFPFSAGGSTQNISTLSSLYTLTSTSICIPAEVTAKFWAFDLCLGDSTGFYNQSNAPLCQWNFGDPASGTSNTSSLFSPKHLYADTGTYTITLIVTDGSGNPSYSDTLEYTTTIVNNKFLSVSPSDTICKGDSALLTAGGVTNWYSWEPGSTLSDSLIANPVATPGITTTYTVTGHNGSCFDKLTVVVTVDSLKALITGMEAICSGDSTILNASGGGTYLWSTGDINPSLTISPSGDSAYWVAVSKSGCVDTAVKNITVFTNPPIDAGHDLTINYGNSTPLSITGSGIYRWNPPEGLSCTDCPSPLATPTANTVYHITLKDANGCTSTDSIQIFVELPCGEVFVPSAFSPNNDGINDVLYPRIRCAAEIEFKIYDRWGENIFETNETTKAWDGTYKGKPMNNGIFVYYLQASLENGELVNRKGQVLLMR